MSNNKWLQASLILSSMAVVIVGIVSNGIYSGNDNLALAYKMGSTVKIVPVENSFPLVSVSLLDTGETTTSSISCQSSDFIDRYYNGSKAKYNDKLTNDAQCLKGRLLVTFYKQQTEADVMSAAAVYTLMTDVKHVLDVLEKNGPGDGMDVVVIPGGINAAQDYPFVDSVTMKCVKGSDKTVLSAEQGVGAGSKQNGSIFQLTNPTLEAALATVKADNKVLNGKVSAFQNAKKPVPGGLQISALKQLLDLKSKMAGSYVALLVGDAKRDYPDLFSRKVLTPENIWITQPVPISVSISFEKDKDGNIIDANGDVGWAVKTLLKTVGLAGNFFSSVINIDGAIYKSPFPIKETVADVKTTLTNHLIRLESLKSLYENRMAQNAAKTKDLEAKNYNCAS